MSQNLYEEAIADARSLKEMAEQSAKNKIIDAVSPRIRQLIEAQILGEQDDLPPEEEGPPEEEEVATLDLDQLEVEDVPPGGVGPALAAPEEVESAAAANIAIDPEGEISLNVGDVEIEISTDGEAEEDLVLSQEVAEALARIVGTRGTSDKRLARRARILERRVKKLSSVMDVLHTEGTQSQKLAAAKIFESLLREAVTLKRQVILTEQDSRKQVLTRRTNSIIKEMNQMSRRSKNDIFDFLFEGEVTDEPAAEEVDVDAASTALEDLGTALGLDVAIGEEGEEAGEEGGDELELGGEEEELDLEETYEIDEAALKRALRGMRNKRINENDPVDGSGDTSFGGGDAGDEPFVEVDEDDLLNALADELGDVSMPDAPGSGGTDTDAMPESYRRRARRRRSRKLSESRRTRPNRNTGGRQNRALNGQLVEYKKAVGALKGQLTEMNLFNAKLLYANKLMQNRNLTPKQQRAIVEALDSAKTLREAKLLYKSLTNSLRKRGSSLNENRSLRSLGSASKSARSAKPITEGAGSVDRWAVLAGIGKDN
jgi:hypothetical protein